jgi:hypothetical protein
MQENRLLLPIGILREVREDPFQVRNEFFNGLTLPLFSTVEPVLHVESPVLRVHNKIL